MLSTKDKLRLKKLGFKRSKDILFFKFKIVIDKQNWIKDKR